MSSTRLLPIALMLFASPACGAATHFGFKPIAIAGSSNVNAAALNNSSTIAGTFSDAGGQHAFIKAGATLTILPAPIANCGCVAVPLAINATGDVAGLTYYGRVLGFLWHQGAFVDAGFISLGIGGVNPANVLDINKTGQEIYNYYTGGGVYVLYSGTPGNFVQLNPPGSSGAFINNINNHDVIAGQSNPDPFQVFTLSNGVYTQFLPPGAFDSFQGFVNDRGQVAGLYQDMSGSTHGFLYRAGKYRSYDFPHGPGSITIDGINNAGRVVGVTIDPVEKSQRAFLYNGTTLAVFGRYAVKDVVHVAINDEGTMLVSDLDLSSGVYTSNRVLCGGDGC